MQLQLYLHFPFCKRKCSYCDFCSAPGTEEEVRAYCRALICEIGREGVNWRDAQVRTVFLGGGTPSLLPPDALGAVLNALHKNFCIEPDAEFTSEANPGTLTMPWLEQAVSQGVDRLSLGVQAAQDRLLKALGRIHTFREAEEAFRLAKEAGIENLNADLMFALPGQTRQDYRETIDRVCALGPKHISAYSLILEEGTPLYREAAAGRISVPDDDAAAEMYLLGREELEKRGFRQYEISNFAKEGFSCRHNMGYWQGAWYLGLGVSAHSMLPPDEKQKAVGVMRVRRANANDRNAYIQALLEGRPAPGEACPICQKEAMFEAMMLGLRMNEGVSGRAFESLFGSDMARVYGSRLDGLVLDGLGKWLPGGSFALTERGMLLQNQALLRLMEE